MTNLLFGQEKKNRIILLSLLAVTFFIFDLSIGPVKIPLRELFSIFTGEVSDTSAHYAILFDFRLPKAMVALIAGAALSVAGLMMQTVFKNPLAGPYVLGINAGASLGVAILTLSLGIFFGALDINFLSSWIQILFACLGAFGVLILILLVSFRVKDIMTILILGILFGSAISAIIAIMQYFSQGSSLKAFIVWSMGSLGSLTMKQVWILLLCNLLGLTGSILLSKPLNALQQGESYAKTIGLPITQSRILVFVFTSLMAGSITAFCGPIGFIGVAVPHLARLIIRSSDHRWLIPSTLLTGIIILTGCDILANLAPNNTTLPINSITALVGIPMIIWIIFKNRTFTSTG